MDPAATTSSTGLNRQNPWPGLQAFGPGDSAYFYGRQAKIEELFALVSRCPLCIFYGQSGLGKTSLIQAGLFAKLRTADFFPVLVRLDHGGDEGSPSLADQVKQTLIRAIKDGGLDAPLPLPEESLWAYFHRRELDFWDARNRNVQPVFVFDQFEEIYTRGRENAVARARSEAFLAELEAVTENRPPPDLRRELASSPDKIAAFDVDRQSAHIMLALREDYLPFLLKDRRRFTGVSYHQCRLERMSGMEAWDVLLQPGGVQLMDEPTALCILHAVASPAGETSPESSRVTKESLPDIEVDPALLSVVCRELNLARIERGLPVISTALVNELQGSILDQFYETALAGSSPAVRQFIEDRLLSSSGDYRLAVAVQEAIDTGGVTRDDVARLVDRRLLHVEDYRGQPHIELAHDRLTQVARTSRDKRREQERRDAERRRAEIVARAQRRRVRRIALIAGVLLLALVGTVGFGAYYWWHYVRVHVRYYAGFTKKHGIAIGLGPQLSDEFVRHRKYSFKFTYEGSPEHGKLTVLQAVSGSGQLTTRHGASTYLRSSEGSLSEDPQRECQWKFITNDSGEVVYEMAFDRHDRLVWGFVYAPPVPGADERKAHFVGRDGFPQSGGDFGAEYVAIQYNKNGFETRHRFLDAVGEPHVGKDGAYGRLWIVASNGMVKGLTSLQRDGRTPMNDDAWNASLMLEHDAMGNEIKARALNADGQPCLTSVGRHGVDSSYDQWGNLVSQRYVGLDNKPTTDNQGVAETRFAYDEQGQLLRFSFHGLDGALCAGESGYAAVTLDYDPAGHAMRFAYFDTKDQPCPNTDGVSIVEFAYDEKGHETARRFFDTHHKRTISVSDRVSGWTREYDDEGHVRKLASLGVRDEPRLGSDGTAGTLFSYDQRDQVTERRFVGIDGKPVYSSEQVAGWTSRFDEHGREVERTFVDKDGSSPRAHKSGYFSWQATYDAAGNLVRQEFLNESDRPMIATDDAVAGTVREYDDRRREIRRSYIGLDGAPCVSKSGDAGYEVTFDDRGQISRFVLLDLAGKPWLGSDQNVASWKNDYDDRGHHIRRTYFDASGKPCAHKDGHGGFEQSYDEHGRVARYILLGVDGKPWLNPAENLSGSIRSYDDRGHETRRTFIGTDGKPCLHKSGYAGYEMTMDEHGNALRTLYLGLDGKPSARPDDRIAGWDSEYDDRGHEIRRRFFGADRKPCVSKEGNAGYEVTYDERGNLTRYASLDVAGKLWVDAAEGLAGSNRVFNDRDREIKRLFFGGDGKPCVSKRGNAGYETAYDERGNVTRYVMLGMDGKPWRDPVLGYAGWTALYDSQDRDVERRYFDAEEKPCLQTGGSAGYVKTRDDRGRITRQVTLGADNGLWVDPATLTAGWISEFDDQDHETRRMYVGADGQIWYNKDQIAGYAITYDKRGRISSYTWLDTDRRPMVKESEPIAGWTIEYDDQGNETKRSYFDASRKPCVNKAGYAGYEKSYDSRGRAIRFATFGLDGNLWVDPADQTAGYTMAYDADGREIRRSYFGADGKPCVNKDGYAGYEQGYDSRGKVSRFMMLDLEGHPWVDPSQGVAGWNTEVDDNGHETRRTYLGPDGKPCLHAIGYAGYEQVQNARGDVTHYARLDLNGNLWVRPTDGVAGWNCEFDSQGHETKRAYFGPDGKPCVSKSGHAGYEQKFSTTGKLVRYTRIGVDGAPWRDPKDHVAGWNIEYDSVGREARRFFFDENLDPCLLSDGYAGWEQNYDARDRVVRLANLGLNGRLWANPDTNVAGYDIEYDDRGRESRRTFIGADGQPCLHSDGYAGYEQSYDDAGHVTRYAMLTMDGRNWKSPVLGYAGYRSTFNSKGLESRRTYFDENGDPVTARDGSVARVYVYDSDGNAQQQAAELPSGQLVPVMHGVKRVIAGAEAQRAGMRAGDVILSYGSWTRLSGDPFRPVERAWAELVAEIQGPGTTERELQVLRNGQVQTLRVKPGGLGFEYWDWAGSDPAVVKQIKASPGAADPDRKR